MMRDFNRRNKLEMQQKVLLPLLVNGQRRECAFDPGKTLLEVLREDLNLTGTKHGCEMGHCGTCTVLIDGQPVLSCLTLALEAQDHEVTTVEGLAKSGRLHPIQQALVETGAAQCGYCTPAFLLTSAALLEKSTHPTLDETREALAGCLCRCTGYTKIYEAVQLAAARMRPPS